MRRGYWFIPKHLFGSPSDESPPRARAAAVARAQVFGVLLRVLEGDLARLGLPKPDHRLFESHPLMNTKLIHHLRHGDITAKPGIADADGTTVHFADGTSDDFDLILFATGYRHAVPVAQRYFGDEQHPNLYLSVFSREHRGLCGVGFIETNSGAYRLFDLQAQLIAAYVQDGSERFTRMIREDRPDLTAGLKFVASPRHTGYVDSGAYLKSSRSSPGDGAARRGRAPVPAVFRYEEAGEHDPGGPQPRHRRTDHHRARRRRSRSRGGRQTSREGARERRLVAAAAENVRRPSCGWPT